MNGKNRLKQLRNQVEQCKKLACALPPGTVRSELEKLAFEHQNEIDAMQSDEALSEGR